MQGSAASLLSQGACLRGLTAAQAAVTEVRVRSSRTLGLLSARTRNVSRGPGAISLKEGPLVPSFLGGPGLLPVIKVWELCFSNPGGPSAGGGGSSPRDGCVLLCVRSPFLLPEYANGVTPGVGSGVLRVGLVGGDQAG